MTFKLSQRSLERMEGVDPRLKEIAELAIKLTLVDFGIPKDGGLRTTERQKELHAMKVSMCDGVKNKSRHQSGKALDFYAYKEGAALWTTQELAMVATAFMQAALILGHKIEWGGLWESFQDMPHVQLMEDD